MISPIPVEEPEGLQETEEERAEREIRAAPDAVEIRVVPLGGALAPFSYVTEYIIRSESVGKQVRKRRKLVPIDGTGERGYQKRGEDTSIEAATKRVRRKDWHKPNVLPEEEW